MNLREDAKLSHLPKRREMLKVIMLFALLVPGIGHVLADDDMTSGLICPCECAMVISTCDCDTAIQVKKEIAQMKAIGFSEKQIVSALQAEYGKEIVAKPEKTSSLWLWAGGISLGALLTLGYVFTRNRNAVPDIKKYEQRFEEEYREFIYETEGKQ